VRAAAYFVWAALAQNSANKPRHLLPLVPLFVLTVAAGADRIAERSRAGLAAAGALASLWLVDAATLARAHLAPSPAAAIVDWLGALPQGSHVVITRDLGRMIAEGAPRSAVRVVDSNGDLVEAIEQSATRVLITTEALTPAARAELTARGRSLRPAFSRPRSRYVDSLWTELGVVEVVGPSHEPGSSPVSP
jgi:hypothetical protein